MLEGGARQRGVVQACHLLINSTRQVMILTVFHLVRFFLTDGNFCCAIVAHLAGTRATAQTDSSSSLQQHPTGSQT